MSDGQKQTRTGRLRWWQEARIEPSPPISAVAVRVQPSEDDSAAVLPDIGLELERIATTCAPAESRVERVVFYADRLKNRRQLVRSLVLALAPTLVTLAVIGGVAAFVLDRPGLFYSVLISLLMTSGLITLLLYYAVTAPEAKSNLPILTLTREGMEIQSPGQEFGLVCWNEITETRAYTAVFRCVGLALTDDESFCAERGASAAFVMRQYQIRRRMFFRSSRRFLAPINLPEHFLPLTADEMVTAINKFRRDNNV